MKWQRALFVGLLAVLGSWAAAPDASAQLDTRHWIPASWSPISSSLNVGKHYLTLTTPEIDPVTVTFVAPSEANRSA